MSELDVDVAVIGSGFGGSVTALLLQRVGLRPALLDRGRHPRFAIGESSTPAADFVLRDLAEQYDLPRLAPLAKYGTWQAAYPHLVCGRKRGFSYFRQPAGRAFLPNEEHANELLVAASSEDRYADTHWLRADVDGFLANEARESGIPFFDSVEASLSRSDPGWIVEGCRDGRPLRLRAFFVIDATGEAGIVPRTLGIASDLHRLTTNSRTVFSHFAGMRPWHDLLAAAGGRVGDHPFYCDHAALHHVLDEGWMWQLRFENDVTSAGFVIDGGEFPLDAAISPESEWNALLARYPSIGQQFIGARIVAPPGKMLRSGRLQRLAAHKAGANWALLPYTAGFIDPLHSTGIAQTFCGIERLVRILAGHWRKPSLQGALEQYAAILDCEFTLIDRLVSGCFLARRNLRLWAAFSMLYFAAATTYERRRHSKSLPIGAAFLCADDPEFRRMVDSLWEQIRDLSQAGQLDDSTIGSFERCVADAIAPYNHVGLCDPAMRNMYRFTAAPV